MLVCASATTLPSVIVSAAIIARIICHSSATGISACVNRRRMSANAAAFDATARYPVIGMGAPS